MPTATSLSQFSFYNVGPLTTTFTAPASCSTAAGRVALAQTWAPWLAYYVADCKPLTYGDCFPSGKSMDEIVSARTTAPAYQGYYFAYNSPAAACPSAWTTAGVAVKNDNGSLSLSGAYAPTYAYDLISGFTATASTSVGVGKPRENPYMNVFAEGLAPGETAVFCCPSSLTANGGGGCYSTLPIQSYTASTACQRIITNATQVTVTFTWNGTAVTGNAFSFVGSQPITTRTTTLSSPTGTLRQSLVGATFVQGVTLVHKAGDLPANTGPANTGATSSVSSSAAVAQGKGPLERGAFAVMAIWITLMLVGSSLMLL